jgi:hypothetical protein
MCAFLSVLLTGIILTTSRSWLINMLAIHSLVWRIRMSGLILRRSKATWIRLGIRCPPLHEHPLVLHPPFPWLNPAPVAVFHLSHPVELALRYPIRHLTCCLVLQASSSMSMEVIEIHDSDSDDPGSAAIPAARCTASLSNPFAPPVPKLRLPTSPFPISPPSATVPDTKPKPKKKGK